MRICPQVKFLTYPGGYQNAFIQRCLSEIRTASTMLSLIAFYALVAHEPTRVASADSSVPDLRARHGYINIAPGVLDIHLRPLRVGPTPAYLWRVEGGAHLPIGRKIALQVGSAFESVVRPELRRFRLAPGLRIGGSNRRVFGFGLVRAGIEVAHVDLGQFGTATGAGFHGAFGGGALGMAHRRISVGGEVYYDVLAVHGRVVGNLSFCLFVGLWFGR